jgi:hypothetical protein
MLRRGHGTNTSNDFPQPVHRCTDCRLLAASRDEHRGEFMAIFYRRNRFEPLEYEHFWLSDTPDVIASSTWGNGVRRMVTWAKFRDRTTGREFYFWNTHLDHEVQFAREKSAELIRQRIGLLPPGARTPQRGCELLHRVRSAAARGQAHRLDPGARRDGRAYDGGRHVPAGRALAKRSAADHDLGDAEGSVRNLTKTPMRPGEDGEPAEAGRSAHAPLPIYTCTWLL